MVAYRMVAVVDITRSMNVEDGVLEDRTGSRLEWVKAALKRLILALPCGSQLGLGVFTERRSALLFMPLEVCHDFHELHAAIESLDWRSAWAADSRIGEGLLDAMRLMRALKLETWGLLFFTDGHEAPPLNPRYLPDFTEVQGLRGMLIGVGGSRLSPIPKFDEEGKRIGVYGAEDVPHRATFGLPWEDTSQLPGYHPRNAPFGGEQVIGQEHLSARKDDHLRFLAKQSGLDYAAPRTPAALVETVLMRGVRQPVFAVQALWPACAGLALLALFGVYLWRKRD